MITPHSSRSAPSTNDGARLRSPVSGQAPVPPPPWLRTRQPIESDVIVTGRLTVDIGALAISVDDVVLYPSANELRLLVALALRLGRAVLYEDLIRMVWWSSYDPADLHMRAAQEHVLRVTTSRLRRRLGDAAAGLLVTIPNIGLRLERVPAGTGAPLRSRSWLHPTLAERGRWAREHACCAECGTTARRHWAHGICLGCRGKRQPSRWHLLRGRRKETEG
jgi:DNA-binding winged helix-turn-helix (wHTH) protein